MAIISEPLSAILSILALISLGFLMKKTPLLKEENASILNNIIIYLAMPALIFEAVLTSRPALSYLQVPLLAYLVMAVCGLLAFLVGRSFSLKRATLGAFLLAAMMGNTGYLGYPLSLDLYGQAGLVKAFFYDLFGTVIFVFTVGLYIAEVYGSQKGKINKLKEILTFPPLGALIFAFIWRAGGLALPQFLGEAVHYLAGATVPLIMFSIGLSLRPAEIKNYKLPILGALLIKLCLSPFIAFLLGRTLLSLPASTLGVSVLEASMPTMMFSLIIGAKYKLDVGFLPAVIVVTTAVSLLTIPLTQYLLRLAS